MKLLRFSADSPGHPVTVQPSQSRNDHAAALSWLTRRLQWEGRLRDLRETNVETLTVTGAPDHHPARARTVIERVPSQPPDAGPIPVDESTRLAAS